MFAKVFEQIFESSIAEDYHTRHVFMDLLVLADEEGVIDKTLGSISRITNVPQRVIRKAIDTLCSPDRNSRTPSDEGRRLVLIDEHRDWGWKIVNYLKYRQIRDEEARRASNRSYKRAQRVRDTSDKNPDSQQCQPVSAHTEAEADTEVDKSKPMTRSLKFALPSIGEIAAYCSERNNRIDPQQFFDYYTANGWKVGRNLMRDWRAAVRTWEKNNFNRGGGNGSTLTKAEQRTVNTRKALLADAGYDFDEAVGSVSEAVPDGDSARGTEIVGEIVGRGKAERR